jgi:hypothetical protein
VKFLIKSASFDHAKATVIDLPSDDPLISEVLEEAKLLVPDYLAKIVFRNGTAFLAHPEGPKRLHDDKHASDYRLADGDVLWLMSSGVLPD